MARARNIKPGLFKNEILGVADPLYTILFEGLWMLADREGRLEDRPLRIKGEVFPYRDGIDASAMLDWLQASGFILRYVVDGKGCILILEFKKHQNPHKNEEPSKIPAPNGTKPEEIGKPPEFIGSTRADPGSLIPDPESLIPECGAGAPLTLPEGFAEILKTRPELSAEVVYRKFCDHKPEKQRTLTTWRQWVADERTAEKPPSTADPDSRKSIEDLGKARGLGKWDEIEPFEKYKARVKGIPA